MSRRPAAARAPGGPPPIVAGVIEVVGVPAAGVAALPGDQVELVRSADVLLSSPRLLASLDGLRPPVRGVRRPWPSPLLPALDGLLTEYAGRRVVVLATGDPLVSGIGATLVRRLGADRVRLHPAVSSVALARARMGWDATTCAWVTLVGRPVESVSRHLTPRARVLCLSSDETTPGALAALLTERGLGATRMTVLGDLGTPDESRSDCAADALAGSMPRLNVVALELPDVAQPAPGPFGGANALLGAAPGRPDTAFVTDGQLTKREVRAVALAALRPASGALLWDLGAGTGSIGVEWCLAHPTARAVAVERDPARAGSVRANATGLGLPIEVVERDLTDGVDGLTGPPDAVFVGGGATPELLRMAADAVRPGGRLVAHAVTLDTEAVLLEAHRRHTERGDQVALHRIPVETAEPLGRYLSWRPARPIVQLAVVVDPTGSTA